MKPRQNGQNLIDYALILSLIAVVALGGIVVFSKQLKTFFDDRQADLNGSAAAVTMTQSPVNSNTTLPVTGSAQPVTPGAAIPAASNLPPDVATLLAQIPSIASSSYIETSGVGGATQATLDYLTTLAKQLEASGVINAKQSSALTHLANVGHQLAVSETWVESIAKNCGSDSHCFTTTLNNRWPSDPATMNLIAEGKINASNLLDPSYQWSMYVACPFQVAYDDALNSGAMDQPEIKQVVTQLSEQIVKMFLATHVQVEQLLNHSSSPAELTTTVAANATHTNSAGICTTGTGVDSGTKCI